MLDKHGINAGQFMGAWQLEITAVVATVSVVMEIRSAVRAEIAQIKAEAEQHQAQEVTQGVAQEVTASGLPT